MAEQTKTSNNCRQIIMAMKIWASDESGVFPDARLPTTATANDVFRLLIRDDIIQDERIFGALRTPFKPDGDLGSAPDFPQALGPGENHWMMVAGLKENDSGATPFIFENTIYPHWPMTWRGDRPNEPVRGRTWRGGKIIIGRLDNSANVETLQAYKSVLILPALLRQGIEENPNGLPRVLDIEEKK